jgi:hypothetical protein
MIFTRDEKGKVIEYEMSGTEQLNLPREAGVMFRQTIKELANTTVEIKITQNVENHKTE